MKWLIDTKKNIDYYYFDSEDDQMQALVSRLVRFDDDRKQNLRRQNVGEKTHDLTTFSLKKINSQRRSLDFDFDCD